MPSAKDTFESHTFRANTFASGTWRGAAGIIAGPYYVEAAQIFAPGAIEGEIFNPGASTAQVFQPGAIAGQIN